MNLGCIENASENIEKALEIDQKCTSALALKGMIQIEKGRYDDAIKSFEKAFCSNPNDLWLFIWKIYAEYLNIEFNLRIKDVEDMEIKESDGNGEYSGEMRIVIRETKYQEGITAIIRKLEKVRSFSENRTERDLRQFILYFLGYFYYKGNDVFKAKEKLEKCIMLESRRTKLWKFINSESIILKLLPHFAIGMLTILCDHLGTFQIQSNYNSCPIFWLTLAMGTPGVISLQADCTPFQGLKACTQNHSPTSSYQIW